jgi:hypothetical protein
VASYQIYLLTPNGDVLRAFELDCAHDQDAVQAAIRLTDSDEVEIEIWERARLVRWLPVPLKVPELNGAGSLAQARQLSGRG